MNLTPHLLPLIYLICLLLSTPLSGLAQENLDASVSLNATNPAVQLLLNQLKTEQGLRLAYSESYLNLEQRIRLTTTNPTVRELLDAISRATNTTYELRNGQIIFRQRQATYTISGYIRDAASGEDLIGANLWSDHARIGTSSNSYGFYSLTLPSRGLSDTDTIRLHCSHVGRATQRVAWVLREDTVIHWNLTDEVLNELTVHAVGTPLASATSFDLPVSASDLLAMPALLGEVDLLKGLQRLPGVQSGVDGSAQLYVRGSGPEHNLLLLDGVPIYHAAHLFGVFSVFSADAINNVDFYKGDVPARFGGRLSSVVDVQLKEGNRERFQGTGAIGLLSSQLMLEGPLLSDKTSFLVSGRYSHLGPVTRLTGIGNDFSTIYSFYDLVAKLNHTFSSRDQVYLSTYRGNDYLDDRGSFQNTNRNDKNATEYYEHNSAWQDQFRWGNATTAFRWNHAYSRRLFSNLTLTHSRYRFGGTQSERERVVEDTLTGSRATEEQRVSEIRDWAAKVDFDYRPAPRHHLRFGISTIYHAFRPGTVTSTLWLNEKIAVDTTFGDLIRRGIESDVFMEDEVTVSRTVTANLGARFSGFAVDRATYSAFQPRVSVQYRPSAATTWRVSYARTAQFMHLLTNPFVSLPTDLWLPTTRSLPPEIAQQASIGYQRALGGPYRVQAEAYFRDMRNVVTLREGGFEVFDEVLNEGQTVSGRGRSYGLELLAQRTAGRLTAWLGYTLSRSERQFAEVDDGSWFPFRYDRRHEVDFGGVFHWKEQVDISWGWGLASGFAFTAPTVMYTEKAPVAIGSDNYNYFGSDLLTAYGPRNGQRTRATHRLDVSIAFRKPTRWGERTWEFGLYNLYSRKNPLLVTASSWGNTDGVRYRFSQRSLFPIVPSVNYRFTF